MKKIFFLLSAIFLVHTSFAQEPKNLNDYIFKAGDVLEYEINKSGKTYRLIITLTGKTFIDAKIVDAITFDWQIPGDTNSKGRVSITKEARFDANVYQTELSRGAVTLKNKSCFWLSLTDKQMLFSPEGTSLDPGDGKKQSYKIIEGPGEKYVFNFKGKPGYISSFRAKSASGNTFNFCPTMNSNGLILSINMAGTIKLKEVW